MINLKAMQVVFMFLLLVSVRVLFAGEDVKMTANKDWQFEIVSPGELFGTDEFGRLNEAIGAVTERALRGDSTAAYQLYEYYAFQKKDMETAMNWLTTAAMEGKPQAAFSLARYYMITAKNGNREQWLARMTVAKYWAGRSGSVDPRLSETIEELLRGKNGSG